MFKFVVRASHYPAVDNVYVADTFNSRVRKVTVSTGIISTVAGSSTSGSYSGDNGPATSAGLNLPTGIALDSAGKFISTFYWGIAFLTPL